MASVKYLPPKTFYMGAIGRRKAPSRITILNIEEPLGHWWMALLRSKIKAETRLSSSFPLYSCGTCCPLSVLIILIGCPLVQCRVIWGSQTVICGS